MASVQSDRLPAEGSVTAWLAEVESAAREARRCASRDQWRISIAGTRVAIDAIGPSIEAWLRPALAHAVQSGAAEETATTRTVELTVWDQASTGIAPPAPFWGSDGWRNRGELPAVTAGGVTAAYHDHAGYLGIFDARRRKALVWVRDAAGIPRYERAAPLRGPLSWVLSEDGSQLAHAAAVATDAGAALLAGPGGSGKSTTAAACLAGGLHYLGDDYVVVRQPGDGPPSVHTLYATAKLTERSFELLPALRRFADGPGTADEKAVLQLAASPLAERVALHASLVAIVLPRVGEGPDSTWAATSPSAALTALAPTTMFQLPGAGRASLSRLAALARSLPAYDLALGRDIDTVAPAVRAIIADAAGRRAPGAHEG